jgi:hypothetical protein
MARKQLSLDTLATDVLRTVEQEQLVKTASVSYVSTELGKLMVKVAENVRMEAQGFGIDYSDLAKFRKRYGV